MRDDDLATFATVDDVLANTAAIRRADALRKCAEVLTTQNVAVGDLVVVCAIFR